MYALIACMALFAFTQSAKLHAQSPEISITQQLPAVVSAGSEFEVTFIINKENLQSFARLVQTLPKGFTAKLKNGKSYHAFLSGNKAKHVWVSLPNSSEFSVTYRIKVSGKISGEFVLGGQFDYVLNNQKQYAIVAPAKITVMPNAVAALEEEQMERLQQGEGVAPVPQGGASAYDDNIFDQ